MNDSITESVALKAIVRGRVQGVSFRYFVMRHASRLGLKGYVRNLPDGVSVELYAEGSDQALKELLKYLWQGSSRARVGSVEEAWTKASGSFSSFTIIS